MRPITEIERRVPIGNVGHPSRPDHGDALPAWPHGAGIRPLKDSIDHRIDRSLEAFTQAWATLLVPRNVLTKFGDGSRVEGDFQGQRCLAARSAASWALTSARGIVFTRPLAMSSTRDLISAVHASWISAGSAGASRLDSRALAILARSFTGSVSASCVISSSPAAMTAVYATRSRHGSPAPIRICGTPAADQRVQQGQSTVVL